MNDCESENEIEAMYRLAMFCATAFLLFVAWIIYMADSGQPMKILALVRSTPYGDKVGHFFIFGVLASLANLAFRLRTARIRNMNVQLGGLLVFVFGALEELSQAFFPQRTVDSGDLLATTLGIVVLGFITSRLARRFDRMYSRDIDGSNGAERNACGK